MLNTSDLFGNFMQSYADQQNKDLMGRVSKTLTQGISNHPKSPLGKSTDNLSFLQGLQSKTKNALGKVGQEAKWFGQDLASNIGDAAKAGGIGVGGMVDMGKGLINSGLGALGVKQAEIQGSGDKVLSTISSLPLEHVPVVGPGLKIATNVLDIANQSFGATSRTHGTDTSMDLGPYNFAFNENADKKYSLFGRKARKRTNRLTGRFDDQNTASYAGVFSAKKSMAGSDNAASAIEERNFQNLHGDTNLGLLTARLGTKMPPVNFRNIADKAVYSFKQKNKFKDPVKAETFEEYRKRIGKLNPSFLKDDPYYNLRGAFEGGLEPELNEEDGMYHLGSRNPKTGEILKRPGHPTWDLMVKGEEEAGYELYQEGDKWFSRKKKKAGNKKEELPEEKTLDRTERIKKAYEASKQSKYKEGGLLSKSDKEEVIEEVVEDKMNVIPEGAFHSRLNKIDEGVSEHVTRKGIPVVTKQGDKIIQHAEVERNEIIFHKEATDTIESLLKKHEEAETDKLKDEIAIECGKYIANQILVNTDDRTGILKTIEYA